MSRVHYMRILLTSVLFGVLAIVLSSLVAVAPTNAATRPFPKYEITYQWIHGTPDPNYDPNAPVGDGCLRDPNAKVTHLTTFAFRATINPCDGVRTTIRFYLELKDGEEPTNEFRFGATWQYTDIANPNSNAIIWKPLENFKFDGKPVSPDLLDVNSMEQVVVHKDGQPVRMNNGRGLYEPRHIIYLDQFGTHGKLEEHTFQFDGYLPINGDRADLSWGTGSTGDTQGGSIGATANGLTVRFQSGADFRYVKDSDYRQFLNVADTATNLPARRDAGWGGDVPGSTYTIEQCLEDRQIRPLVNSATAAESYYQVGNGPANIPAPWEYESLDHTTPVNFWGPSGSNLLAAYPYEFIVGAVGDFDSLTGVRVMNLDPNGGKMNLPKPPNNFPYKPTLHGLAKDVSGYRYVDNDLPVVERGLLDVVNTRSGKYPWLSAKNVLLGYNKSGDRVKHYYFTYEQIKGSFDLEKFDGKNPDKKLANATFALLKKESYKAYNCALPTDPKPQDYQVVNVCSANGVDANAPGCEATSVRAVSVPGGNQDGTFTTDENGRFVPSESQWLEPGEYFVREVKAPEGYVAKTEFTAFKVDTDTSLAPNLKVANEEPPTPPTPPVTPPTPPTPPAPPTPPTPRLSRTGANVLLVTSFAVLSALVGFVLMRRREM